ncbi:MAG: carboxypeptidase regulatory-like domain-containing protein [Candidatus Cloacimonetes bacterium]|nr:carboxypeptidase regulatory-like domain-containing protein [Candidatus Cloacimonadota bacterium]
MRYLCFIMCLPLLLVVIISGLNAQIVDLPYYQNFDSVTVPELPDAWQSTVPSLDANIRTDTINPQSNPNCLRIYSGASANGLMQVILPEQQNPALMNSLRLRLWVRSSSATAILSFGVMSDPSVSATYSQVQTIQPGTVWKEHILNLSTYTGNGKYITLRSTPSGQNTYFFIDNVVVESIPQNDLAVVSLTGNNTPSLNYANTYHAEIKNYGLSTQSNYQVKLYGLGDTELASVTGGSINTGATAMINLSWTPTTTGMNVLYATVMLNADEFPYNNSSNAIEVSVMQNIAIPPLQPTSEERYPLDFFYKNSLCQYTLLPGDFSYPPVSGMITSIELINNFIDNIVGTPCKIWMGTTTQVDLTYGWIPTSQMTLVFDGLNNYPSGVNNIRYQLIAPFPYNNGQNLVIMFYRPMDISFYSSFDKFECRPGSTNRTRRVFSDSTVFDPNNPTNTQMELSNLIPVTRVYMYPALLGNVSGIVRDNLNAPITGVTVKLGSLTTQTNADGSYSFLGAAAGEKELSFSKTGYYAYTQNVVVSPIQTQLIDMVLYRQMGSLYAYVVNSSGVPIQGATIQINGQNNLTDANGECRLDLPAGSYTLTVSKIGMLTQNIESLIIAAEHITYQLVMLLTESAIDDPSTPELSNMLLNCYPNPFRESASISYQLKQAENVNLSIYNIKGQLIRTMISSTQSPGTYSLTWDGKDTNGRDASNGIYFYRLQAGSFVSSKRLVKLSSQ